MMNAIKKAVCCLMSVILVFGAGITAFAADAEDVPVIVINDMNANPIVNTADGSVVFDLSDYDYDVLFTDGFSAEIYQLFSPAVMEQIQSGDLSTSEIITMLADYMGFSGDINLIFNKVMEIVAGLVNGIGDFDIQAMINDIDFDNITNDIKAKLQEVFGRFDPLKMNDDGTPANADTGCAEYPENLNYYYREDSANAYKIAGEIGVGVAEEIGYDNTYIFTYDWRLDPAENASRLNDYIKNLKSTTGADKVSVISEGYGSTVAVTYLSEFEAEAAADVKNFVTVSSEFLGTSLMGDFFSDEIVDTRTDLNGFTSAYLRYLNDISDNPLTAFTTWLVNYILNNEWELQGFCFRVEGVFSALNSFMSVSGMTAEMAKMPGLWAMVPTEDYEAAADNLIGDDTDKALVDKIESFKATQSEYKSILLNAKAKGVNVYAVAAWNLQIVPVGENNSVQSDGVVDTAYAGFGATCVSINSVTEAMNAEQAEDLNHDHISDTYGMLTPWYSYGGICHYIDASTCALPENTWFIENMKHGTFNSESNSMDFLLWLLISDTERTVWQEAVYTQFMQYNRYIVPGELSSNGVTGVPSDIVDPGKFLLGDINLDGKVTSIDSRLALRSAAGLEVIQVGTMSFKNGDVYPDGVINAADARKILLMSAGLVDDMLSGIELDYVEEQGTLTKSTYTVRTSASYNPVLNTMSLTVFVPDAVDSYSGNFAITYDTKMFTYVSAENYDLVGGYTAAGNPVGNPGILTCAYSTDRAVTAENCNENGELVLATFTLEVSRTYIVDTTLTAGAVHFYENGEDTFVEPFALNLDEEFFMMIGDADNNRYLSAADARIILRIAARLETVTDEAMFKRCDVDGDGVITSKDARLVLRASARLITSYNG